MWRLKACWDWLVNYPSRFMRLYHAVLELLGSKRSESHIAPTFVYILPAGAGGLLAQCVYVPPGSTMQIVFQSVMALPKGSWIVAVGPATVTELRIGNQSQVAWASFEGHIASTWDEAAPGTRIMVALRG